jgi:hypothetical protein
MAKKILVPVLPSDRFYEAVVRAGDIIADEGGLIVFAFTTTRPPQEALDREGDGQPDAVAVETDGDSGDFDGQDYERWREQQVAALEDARQLLYERGVGDHQIDYLFADEADREGAAQAIADEAAAGAFDLVILARGYFENEVIDEDSTPQEIARAVQDLEGPSLLVA